MRRPIPTPRELTARDPGCVATSCPRRPACIPKRVRPTWSGPCPVRSAGLPARLGYWDRRRCGPQNGMDRHRGEGRGVLEGDVPGRRACRGNVPGGCHKEASGVFRSGRCWVVRRFPVELPAAFASDLKSRLHPLQSCRWENAPDCRPCITVHGCCPPIAAIGQWPEPG